MKGGKRANSGRKPLPLELKKIPIGLKLPRWIVEWMREQPQSQAVLIENALKHKHKLNTPTYNVE